MYRNKPHFVIKANLQKSKQTGIYFRDILTFGVLTDVCRRITGLSEFTYDYVDDDYRDEFLPAGYNKGRMAILQYRDTAFFISFSERNVSGRNSSVQSVPTAFNLFYMNSHKRKKLCYYFLNKQGNVGTDYQVLMYRLMKTVGFEFLNETEALEQTISAFTSIEDIMHTRNANANKNRSNHSTYITKSSINQFDIYGKTYGANKYETSMMCYALSLLAQKKQKVTLYEMLEGNLDQLPASSLAVLRRMGNIKVVPTDMQLEKREFEGSNSLRSPSYTRNLLERLGAKRCALCGCEIPELIQGAHIWPVADIKRHATLSMEEKIHYAVDGDNGLWLCENHHALFDQGLISIDNTGKVNYRKHIEPRHIIFMDEITTIKQLPDVLMTDGFLQYLDIRNRLAC